MFIAQTAWGSTAYWAVPIGVVVLLILVLAVYAPARHWLQRRVWAVWARPLDPWEERLQNYNRALTVAVSLDEVAETLLEAVRQGISHCEPALFLPDRQMKTYRRFNADQTAVAAIEPPLLDLLRETTELVELGDRGRWPTAWAAHAEQIAALRAQLFVPLHNGSELLGMLTFTPEHAELRLLGAERGFLQALADQTVIALERANIVRRLEARVSELDTLSQFSQALNFTIAFDDLLELIFINYLRAFDIGDFYIYLHDSETEQVYPVFCLRDGERYTDLEGRAFTVAPEHTAVHSALKNSQIHVTADAFGETTITAPLNAGASPLGAIHTSSRQSVEFFRSRQKQLFTVFSDRAATAIERILTNNRLQRRAQQLEIINEVTFTLASTLELDPLLEVILDKAMELLATEAGTFMMTLPDTGELEFRVARGPSGADLIGTRLPLGTGLAGTAAQSGRPILVNRVQEDDRWFPQVDETSNFRSQSILTVPLVRKNTVLGVLQVINKVDGGLFTGEDQQLLMAFAGQAVVALENARLWRQTDAALQQSVDELSLLQQLDRDLNTTLDLEHVLNLTLERTIRIGGGSAGAIVLVDEEGTPTKIVTRGYEQELTAAILQSGRGLIAKVLRTGTPDVAPNVHEAEGYESLNFNTHSQLTLPFVNKQTLLGAIAIESEQIDAFPARVVETAVRVTNHAAVAIANAVLLEKVNEANNAKSEFVSMVSHELKTPMTSMRGYTDLMLSGMTGELTEQQSGFLETMSANLRRMGQQIQDLTDISRIETGQLHVQPEPTLILPIVNETLQSIKGPCDEKGIQLQLELPEDLPLIMADGGRIVQVLTNLLSNACKYSPPKTEVQLRFSYWSAADESSPMVLCEVRDSGYGMSGEDLAQLFTKFFRSDNPNIRQAKGTGLGLSITKGIIELHGGEIWVESVLNEGTTFFFTVPIAPAEAR